MPHRRIRPSLRHRRLERRRSPSDGDHDNRQGETESEDQSLRVPTGDHQAADSFDGTGPYGKYRPYATEPEGDEHGKEHDHDHAEKPTTHVDAHQRPDREEDDPLQKAERDHAG